MARQRPDRAAAASRKRTVHDESRLLDEGAAILALAVAVFTCLSFAAYQGGTERLNFTGRVGYGLADAVLQALGLAAYLGPVFLAGMALLLFRQASQRLSVGRALGALAMIFCAAVLLGLATSPPPARPLTAAGGWVGGFAASLLEQAFGRPGSFVIVGAVAVLSFVVVTRVSLRDVASLAVVAAGRAARGIAVAVRLPAAAMATRRRKVNLKRETPVSERPPIVVVPGAESSAAAVSKRRRPRPVQEELPFVSDDLRYRTPPLDFLALPEHNGVCLDQDSLHKSSQILEVKLADFGIEAKVVKVRPGPIITTFDVEPAPGVKVNRIVNLADDLTMALRASGVRILAPVPGKAVVGIEVANPRQDKVMLRELIESDAFVQSRSLLTLALGKDTAGNAVIGDLAQMPHLLIAGATGSGKSVAINAMIMSILYKASPRDVRFVMIDLKMLELSVYEDIPHLLVPVVTDPKQCVTVLSNIVELMEERYHLMKQRGVRGIDGYNRLIDRELEVGAGPLIELKEVADDAGENEEVVTPPPSPERLPKIVVIMDELADLMMTMGRKVEEPITRLAQKARAAGVHLIVATQRPSVDVITGLIKANFPARMSFQTTARVDSRTILDHIGAERLLGRGDMLYMPPGSARLQRLHGPLVVEAEIHKVVRYVKKQGSPQYVYDLLQARQEEDEQDFEEDLSDELYDQAVRLVTESQQASISWVQRRLRIGYNRAARMIERMEREGVVSPSEGGRPREVLAQRLDAD